MSEEIYRIRNKITNRWWEGPAKSAREACDKAGWTLSFCEIKIGTSSKCGAWKKYREEKGNA